MNTIPKISFLQGCAQNKKAMMLPKDIPFFKALVAYLLTWQKHTSSSLRQIRVYVPYSRVIPWIQDILYQDGIYQNDAPEFVSFDTQDPVCDRTLTGWMLSLLKPLFPTYPLAQMLDMAKSLVDLWKQSLIYETDLLQIQNVWAENLPVHHQSLLVILQKAIQEWPLFLRTQIPEADMIKFTRPKDPCPDQLTIIAGSQGTLPSTRKLMRTIYEMQKGLILFPYVSGSLPNDLKPSHPLYGFTQTLWHLGITYTDLPVLEGAHLSSNLPKKTDLQSLFLSSYTTETSVSCLQPHISSQIFQTHFQEGQGLISLLTDLSRQNKTCLFVTPDTSLACHVCSSLTGSGFSIEAPSFLSMCHHPYVSLIFSLLDLTLHPERPKENITFASHPYVIKRYPLLECLLPLLQNAWPSTGILGTDHLLSLPHDSPLARYPLLLSALHQKREERLRPFYRGKKHRTIAEWKDLHQQCLQEFFIKKPFIQGSFFSQTDADFPKETEQQDTAQQDLLRAIDTLDTLSLAYPPLTLQEYTDFLKDFLQGHSLPAPPPSAPTQIIVCGPREARLFAEHVDVCILSGLSEDVWPKPIAPNPWITGNIQEKLNFPSLAWQTGLSARDFMMTLSCRQTILTRHNEGGKKSVSPFWARLQMSLERHRFDFLPLPFQEAAVPSDASLADASPSFTQTLSSLPAIQVDTPELTSFSARALQEWTDQPYAFYLKHVLHLHPEETTCFKKQFAIRFRQVLDAFLKRYPCDTSFSQVSLCQGLSLLSQEHLVPYCKTVLEQKRLDHLLEKLAAHEHAYREAEGVRYSYRNLSARIHLELPQTMLTVKTFIDRIDVLANGAINVMAYKTGATPTLKSYQEGHNIWALMAIRAIEQGLLKNLSPTQYLYPIHKIGWWHFSLSQGSVLKQYAPIDVQEKTLDIGSVLWTYLSGEHPYTIQKLSPYDHWMDPLIRYRSNLY